MSQSPRFSVPAGTHRPNRTRSRSPFLEYRVADRAGSMVVVELRGELIGPTWSDRLQDFLEEQYLDDGIRTIRLDLSEIDSIDEQGRRTLLDLRRAARQRGKRLVVKGAPVSRSFPATADALAAVRAFVRRQAAQMSLSGRALEELVVAVSEASTNAVQHSGTRRLHVLCREVSNCVEVVVEDEGVYKARLPSLADLGEGGRGILLMMAMVDEIAIHEGTARYPGTAVRLLKCREPDGG